MFICHCVAIDNQYKTFLTSISLKCIQFESNYTTRPEILNNQICIEHFVSFHYKMPLNFTILSIIDESHINSFFFLYYLHYITKNSCVLKFTLYLIFQIHWLPVNLVHSILLLFLFLHQQVKQRSVSILSWNVYEQLLKVGPIDRNFYIYIFFKHLCCVLSLLLNNLYDVGVPYCYYIYIIFPFIQIMTLMVAHFVKLAVVFVLWK